MKTIFPLIISNTDLSLLSQCELRWFRERCQVLRRPSFNIDLTAGGTFAKGLEITRTGFYQDKLPSAEAIVKGYNYILEEMHKQMEFQDTDVLKSPERMAIALVEYFRNYPLESDDCIPAEREDGSFAIEHTFTIELPILHPELNIPLIFKGKLDMLAKSLGRNWIVDEKTTKIIAANTGDLLKTAGQFIGYAWAAREKGIRIEGVKVRKVAIQIKEIKFQEFEVPITDFMVDRWYESMLSKVTNVAKAYKDLIKQPTQRAQTYFNPDYQQGCTSFFKPCPYSDGCASKYGEKFLETNFEQLVWDSESKTEVGIDEYRKLIGLGE